jgi:hypothetical protein
MTATPYRRATAMLLTTPNIAPTAKLSTPKPAPTE